jgi:PHP family Zn ribbon phosphoesterase
MREYQRLLKQLGPELYILKDLPLEALDRAGAPLLKAALRKMRRGDIQIKAGYDGEYGKISIFREGEREQIASRAQKTLF